MTASPFSLFELKNGDSDKNQIWGSQKRSMPGGYVAHMQNSLRAVSIPLTTVDGEFGPATEWAVKMFQWCVSAHPYRIFNQTVVNDTQHLTLATSGCLDKQTGRELSRWLSQGYAATGDLIRIDTQALSHTELGSGFRVIKHASIRTVDVVLAAGALELIRTANDVAGQHSVKLVLNQSMRVNGVPVSGAVVTPATRSQHLIGHAIDCNIVDGDRWNTSQDFANSRQTQAATQFITDLKNAGFRWGGDFSSPDTPHFDKRLNPYSDAYDFKYYFNQRTISNSLPIPLKTLG